jgi:N-acetylglucosamine kinase-like BadF-type ATPase
VIFVGVDGGGTTTRCLASDEQGNTLAVATGPATNIHELGIVAASQLILELLERTLQEAGLTHGVPAISAAACIAGIDTDESRTEMRTALEAGTPVATWRAESDSLAAWAAAFPGGSSGIVAVSGTGAIALARNGTKEARAGGWGAELGDPGSGFNLGRSALIAVLSAADAMGPTTTLGPAILAHLGLTRPHQIIDHVHFAMRHTDIAALAPLVLDHAERGDVVAVQISESVARSIIRTAVAAGNTVGLNWSRPAPFALLGGLANNHYFARLVETLITDAGEPLAWRAVHNEPVVGAVRLAMQAAHTPSNLALVAPASERRTNQ